MRAQIDRRKLLVGATALAGYSALARAAVPYEWQTTSPAEAGFLPGFGERLNQFILSGRAPNIHGVIIVRRRRLVFENYFVGDDQVRDKNGRAFRTRRVLGRAQPRSALCEQEYRRPALRIALREGKVPPLEELLLAQFPQYTDLPDLEERRSWTVRHAITMTLGIDWNEMSHARRSYPQVFPKYRNPAEPSETWAGRGKRPRWLTAQLKSGKQIDDFRIDLATA